MRLSLITVLTYALSASSVISATSTNPTASACKSCNCSIENHNPPVYRVDCSRLRLQKPPINQDLPLPTKYLDLSQNNIKQITQFEANEELVSLDLRINDIEKIEPISFEHVPQLAVIDLSFNKLNEIPETLFEHLENLVILNLANNKIELLPTNLLRHNPHLFELNLSNNPIKFISPDFFSYSKQLETLHMAHNEFSSLSTGLLHQLPKLTNLDISGNDFQGVPINALVTCRNLLTLDLSGNPIKVISEGSFYKMHTLRELKMNHMNSLTEIQPKAFSSLFNLEVLSIDDSPLLTYIDKHAFLGAYNHSWIAIKSVSFRRNGLRSLSEETLPFCNLTYLDLRENQWHCNCHLHWIKYCHGDKKFEKGIICTSPTRLRNQELQIVPHTELVCEAEHLHTSNLLLVTSLFLVSLLFVTLALFIFRDRITTYYGNKRKQGSIYYVRAQSEHE